MNAHEFAELRDRLAAFQLDDPEAAYPFSARLARENGWSRFGRRRSLEAQQRAGDAAAARARFERAWQRADVTITSSRIMTDDRTAQRGGARR